MDYYSLARANTCRGKAPPMLGLASAPPPPGLYECHSDPFKNAIVMNYFSQPQHIYPELESQVPPSFLYPGCLVVMFSYVIDFFFLFVTFNALAKDSQ